jgi:hypothetical protein
MWAAAVELGAAGPIDRLAGAADGEDADEKANKSAGEDCSTFAGRFKRGDGEGSRSTCWPPGSAMVDSICCGLLETLIMYRGSSGSQIDRACGQ